MGAFVNTLASANSTIPHPPTHIFSYFGYNMYNTQDTYNNKNKKHHLIKSRAVCTKC